MVATAPKKRLSAADRRATLLDAAASLIRDGGTDAITMEAVAARCGVDKALGYRHFANRDHLLIELAEREWVRLDEGVAAAIAAAPDLDAKIGAVVRTYFDAVEGGTLAVGDALSRPGAGGAELSALQQKRIVSILAFFADMVRADLPIDPVRALEAAALLTAGINGVVQLWQVTGADRTQIERDCVAMCRGALDALVPR